jgi:hypothetical protein
MKNVEKNSLSFRLKKTGVAAVLLSAVFGLSALSSMEYNKPESAVLKSDASTILGGGSNSGINKDSLVSARAFLGVYKVLMNPACMNCHPAGDIPLQGTDSHLHTMGVQRGVDGKGVTAMKCANCHQATNLPGPHMPPGNPNWHLPPADMKMVFQGKSPRQLARQLLDPKLNGGKSKADLIKHAAEDQLVAGSWNHGEGKSVPPISHAEFARLFKLWIDKGAYLPGK